MGQPFARFAIGLLLGAIASFSISFGLIAVVAAFAAVAAFGIAWRSHAAIAGGLSGWGLTWLVVIGSTYTRCVAMGPDCGGGEGMVPFLVVAGLILVAGVSVGLLGIARDRAKRAVDHRP